MMECNVFLDDPLENLKELPDQEDKKYESDFASFLVPSV